MTKVFTGILFAMLTAPSFSLTIRSHQNEVEEAKLCGDAVLDPLIKPVLQDFRTFWNGKGYALYPGAVSALGALRYGGNAILDNGKRHMLDHDTDYLTAGPKNLTFDLDLMKALYDEGLVFLTKKGWQQGQFDYEREGMQTSTLFANMWVRGIKDDKGRSYRAMSFRIKSDPNVMQLSFQRAQLSLALDAAREMMPGPLKGLNPLLEAWDKNTLEDRKREFPETKNSRPWVQFDFFFVLGRQDELQPHPTKKMLFHGVNLQYPQDPSIIVDALQAAFWDTKSPAGKAASQNDICLFALPKKLFTDDMEESDENTQVAKKCSAALAAHGYESLDYCNK